MLNKKRLNVHLYVTPFCNLQCKHCYYNAKSVKNNITDVFLTIEDMSFILTSLCDHYAAAFDIEGGEFFLRKDIAKLFQAVPLNYWKNMTITTNGTVKIGVDHKYLQHLDEFRISIEGHTDDLQQDIRDIGLKPILKTCEKLRENDIPITLRITLHKKNYKYIIDIINYFINLGFTRFSLYEFQAAGRGSIYEHEYSLKPIEMEEVLRLLCMNSFDNRIKMLKLNLGVKRVPMVMAFQQKLAAYGYEIIDVSGVASLTVDYNGTLGVCPWNVAQEKIGMFRKETFISDISRYLETGILAHNCNYCSAIKILYNT